MKNKQLNTFDTSQILKSAGQFSSLIRELNQQKNMTEAEIADLESQQDAIVHRLERPDCLYKERSKLATQLATVRRRRRVLKDWLKINNPYFQYIGGENGERMGKMIGNVVSIGRKVKDKGDAIKLRKEVDRV